MNESTPATPVRVPSSRVVQLRSILRILAWGAVAVTLAFVVNSLLLTLSANEQKNNGYRAAVRSSGLIQPTGKHLASKFTDSQGRLLADPPSDAAQLVDPKTIVLAHIVGKDAENPGIPWDQLEAALSAATGRNVVDQVYVNTPEQLKKIEDGEYTIVALHAAETPFLVDNYGFQPAAVLGDESGIANGNKLDILVPAKSTLSSVADLAGHGLVCTVPSSVTGYRAPVAMLMQDQGLRPNVDYTITWSLGQKQSILGVKSGQYEAVAVSDDKLQSLLGKNKIAPADYKMIYQSQVIPRTTIGWFNNLKPELVEKIQKTILGFVPKPAADSDSTASDADLADNADDSKPLRFIPIDYKKDFQFVREIDDRFDPRLDPKPKTAKTATTEP